MDHRVGDGSLDTKSASGRVPRIGYGTHLIVNHDASLMVNTGYIYDDDVLERDREESLPGRRNNEILPGYAKDALLKAATALWGRANQESEETT